MPKNSNIKTIVIYATKPIGKVIGEFDVEGIVSHSPEDLWEKTKDKAGISKKFFSEYFFGREVAHAFKVGTVKAYEKQLNIEDVCNKKVPPQFFFYI